jgi:hypothetical protein
MVEQTDLPVPPLSSEERQAQLEADIRALARVQILAGATTPPPPTEKPRPSLAVKAVAKGSVWARVGMAVLGAAVLIAELLSTSYPVAGPLRALFKVAIAVLQGSQDASDDTTRDPGQTSIE